MLAGLYYSEKRLTPIGGTACLPKKTGILTLQPVTLLSRDPKVALTTVNLLWYQYGSICPFATGLRCIWHYLTIYLRDGLILRNTGCNQTSHTISTRQDLSGVSPCRIIIPLKARLSTGRSYQPLCPLGTPRPRYSLNTGKKRDGPLGDWGETVRPGQLESFSNFLVVGALGR